MATGQDVPDFVGMDAAEGEYIEVYKGKDPGNPYARISGGALLRPTEDGGNPDPGPDPGPDPNPPDLGDIEMVGLPLPKTGDELQAIINDAAAKGYVACLAPGTKLNLTKTIVIKQNSHGGEVWGINGNWAQLDWTGPAGQDMIRVEGVNGVSNRGFVFQQFQLYGGGYDKAPCGACFKITCPGGDSMSYYKSTIHSIYASYGTVGFVFEGAVFEFAPFNLHGENMREDGMRAVSMGGAIMSNCFNIAPNMSRNAGFGINTGYSHNIVMGSFINNSKGGVYAPGGLRVAAFNNGENTGEAVFQVPSNGYGSVLLANEGSTGWMAPNNFGAPSTQMRYLLAGQSSVTERDGHIATYGAAESHKEEIRVRK